jgi:hypothetical protein
MSEELTEDAELCCVTSRWTHEDLNGKTVSFTEKGGREDILWLGVIHAELVGEAPGSLLVSIEVKETADGMRRRKYPVTQVVMDRIVAGSGRLRSDFHISTPTLPE